MFRGAKSSGQVLMEAALERQQGVSSSAVDAHMAGVSASAFAVAQAPVAPIARPASSRRRKREVDDVLPAKRTTSRVAKQAKTRVSRRSASRVTNDDSDSAVEFDASIVCETCGVDENDDELLLCDGKCNTGYHIYCLRPKMEKIPPGDWYCLPCRQAQRKAELAAKRAAAKKLAAAQSKESGKNNKQQQLLQQSPQSDNNDTQSNNTAHDQASENADNDNDHAGELSAAISRRTSPSKDAHTNIESHTMSAIGIEAPRLERQVERSYWRLTEEELRLLRAFRHDAVNQLRGSSHYTTESDRNNAMLLERLFCVQQNGEIISPTTAATSVKRRRRRGRPKKMK